MLPLLPPRPPVSPKLSESQISERIETPTAMAMFPGEKELVVPREWAERCYNIERWTDMPAGGHFRHSRSQRYWWKIFAHFFASFAILDRQEVVPNNGF